MSDERAYVGTPGAGFYAHKLVSQGVRVPIRIWFGPPLVERRLLDRSPRWQAVVNGLVDDVWSVWPFCAGSRIERDEYRFLLKREAWARRFQPEHPAANPRKRIDVRSMPPIF